jgi:hypothetical protein
MPYYNSLDVERWRYRNPLFLKPERLTVPYSFPA